MQYIWDDFIACSLGRNVIGIKTIIKSREKFNQVLHKWKEYNKFQFKFDSFFFFFFFYYSSFIFNVEVVLSSKSAKEKRKKREIFLLLRLNFKPCCFIIIITIIIMFCRNFNFWMPKHVWRVRYSNWMLNNFFLKIWTFVEKVPTFCLKCYKTINI